MHSQIRDEQWDIFLKKGYLHLGEMLEDEELQALLVRIDEIMLGKSPLDYGRIMMQMDAESVVYKDMLPQTKGHKGPSLNYRKITELELDPLFLSYLQKPIFREICARVYGPDTPIATNRAMMMNKPAKAGTYLPWHHDGFSNLDREPLIIVWTALDRTTVDNGCIHIVPGSHHNEVPTHPSEEQIKALLKANDDPIPIELQAGESVLLHNRLLHTSAINTTDHPRRAFSVCYIDGATKSDKGTSFPIVFGEGALRLESVQSIESPETGD